MAEEIVFKLEVDDSGAVQSLDNVDQSVESVGDSAKKSQKGVKGLGQTLKALGSAAGVIGLIATAFITLKKALESSEEGQNKIAKFFAVTESLVDNLITLISDLSLKVIELFENPQQTIKDFANLIKDNIVNRFEGLLELIPQLGKAINLLFEGEFTEAGKVATNAVAKVGLGIENIVEKTQSAIDATVEFTKELVNEANVAGAIADKRALADKKERDLIVARAEANRKIAENRERAADKENVSTEERIRLLEEAGAIAEEITRKEIEAARLRFEAIQEENKLSNSNKEALDAEAQAQAQLIELETARLQQQKALTAELTTTRREAASEQKAIRDQAKAEQDQEFNEFLKDFEGFNSEVKRINKETSDAQIAEAERVAKIEEEAQKNKLDIAKNALGAVSAFAEEGTELSKGVAIAQVGIDVAKGLTGALSGWSSLGPFGIAGAVASSAAIVASGIKSISNIQGARVGSAKSQTPVTPSTASVQAPEFNVEQTNQNQLADTIGGQLNNSPTKAYVVGSDVTTQQEFDRVQLNNATL
jgi:hypothetical protein